MKRTVFGFTAAALLAGSAQALPLLNEFEPNPPGGDPSTQDVELLGDPNTNFDLWILSIENDGFNGLVDRATNVTGSFGADGLAVVTIGDLENPSNTVILTDSFTGSTSTDIDPSDDGTLDLSTIGTVFDAVGVSDEVSDDTTLYGALLGGTDILFNGQFEPLSVFRDSGTGEWYNTVTVNFGDPDQFIGVFDAAGNPIDAGLFDIDPTATTFGAVNPTIPEPSSLALIGLGGLLVARRRRG